MRAGDGQGSGESAERITQRQDRVSSSLRPCRMKTMARCHPPALACKDLKPHAAGPRRWAGGSQDAPLKERQAFAKRATFLSF